MRILRTLCTLALLFCLPGAALADDLKQAGDPERLGFSATRLARIAAWYQARSQQGDPPGFVVGIARNGRLAALQAVGFQDREKQIPMKPDSIFLIASMSKPITSVAAMILVEEGRLDLDAPVAQYLPDLKDMKVGVFRIDPASEEESFASEPQKRPMTIRDLLRHTSGLVYPQPEYGDPGYGDVALHMLYGARMVFRRDQDLARFVASLGALPLAHQPGEVWEYSLGVDVLGRVVEVVSGEALDRFLQDRLFGPLKMVDTGFFVPEDKLDRLVASPTPRRKRIWDVTTRPALFSGGGGLVSTAPDYLRFCQMLLNGGELDGARILKPGTVRLMTTDALPAGIRITGTEIGPAYGTSFGLGFGIRVNPDFSRIPGAVGSYSWSGAWGTHFWVDPAQRLIGILMMQRPENRVNGLYFNAIHQLTYGALLVPQRPARTAPAEPDAGVLAEYAGRYVFGGSTSPLNRQDAIADTVSWTGLESVVAEHGGLRVVKPADGGPAARAGVLAGDLITAVDGQPVKDSTLEQAVRRLSGPVNTPARLRIIREGAEAPIDLAFPREPIPSRGVELRIRVAGGRLVVESTGVWPILDFALGDPTPVAALSKDEFRVEHGDRTRIAFTRDSTGRVNGAVLNPGPWEQRGVLAKQGER
jgi:CubicO group peptidase (beta-lactamase class C family)